MTVVSGGNGGGGLDGGSGTNLADVVGTILDKGIVIDAQVQIGVIGINLVDINTRVVVASVETYLRFAEVVDRLDITPKSQKGIPDLVEGVAGGRTKRVGQGTKEIAGTVLDVVDHFSGKPEWEREPRRREGRE